MKKKKALLALALVMGTIVLVSLLRPSPTWLAHAEKLNVSPTNEAGVALGRPDALIRSQSLTDLPADLLHVPLLKDVFTEDLLFYYDTDEDWLGLKGSLRRIAYEHDLDLNDKLLSFLLSRPADVLLWRDGKGALRHYAVALQGDALTGLAANMAKVVAGQDNQLSKIGEFSIGATAVPVYALKLSPRRTYALVFYQDRLVAFSDTGMVMGMKHDPKDDTKQVEVVDEDFQTAVTRWLAPEEKDRLGRFEGFPLSADAHKHSILLSSRFLSQGYSGFFPGFSALRFDFSDGRWSTQGLFDLPPQGAGPLFNAAIWQHVPANAAACELIPASWSGLERFQPDDDGFSKAAAHRVTTSLQPSGVVCWYADARLYAPLFVTSLKPGTGADINKSLTDLFNWTISGHKNQDGVRNTRLNIRKQGEAQLWSRAEPLVDERENPTLAHAGDNLYFSVDAKLVNQALAVERMRFPAQADAMNGGPDMVLFHTDTRKLSQLLGHEVGLTVATGSEDADIVRTRLTPRLQALANHGQLELVMPTTGLQGGQQWVSLSWRSF